jgi:hypothetical protein
VNHLLGLANRTCEQQLEPFGGVVVAADGVVQVVAAPFTVTRHTSRGGEQPSPRITLCEGYAATKSPPSLDRHVRDGAFDDGGIRRRRRPDMTSFAMPIASAAVVDGLNATLATTKNAEASAMASEEETGHVDAPCEWWRLEVSTARATFAKEVRVYAAREREPSGLDPRPAGTPPIAARRVALPHATARAPPARRPV